MAEQRNNTHPKKRSGTRSLVELVVIVAVALGLALAIQAFIVKPYRIPSPSMVPTLAVGQRVLVNRIANDFSNPKVGQILVFHPPSGVDLVPSVCGNSPQPKQPCQQPTPEPSKTNFIKRVVAGPGQRIAVVNGRVILDGVLQKEPFIRPCAPNSEQCNFPKEIVIPAGHYYMMGDNRGDSEDSRFWGAVPRKWIIGRAFFTYWPPGRVGTL